MNTPTLQNRQATTPIRIGSIETSIDELMHSAVENASERKADNTRTAYDRDMNHLRQFCSEAGLQALPAEPATVALYVEYCRKLCKAGSMRPATVARRLAGIGHAHKSSGYENPARHKSVRVQLQNLKRDFGTVVSQPGAILANDVRSMIDATPGDTLQGIRDRALLLLGWYGALRRSELAGLDLADLALDADGVVLTLKNAKTDKDRAGQVVGIARVAGSPYCPVTALERYLDELDAHGINSGRVFRSIRAPFGKAATVRTSISGRGVNLIVKAAASRAGLNPDEYGAHSLRSGHITEAYRRRIPEHDIMRTSRHKTLAVLRGYEQAANVYQGSAAQMTLA